MPRTQRHDPPRRDDIGAAISFFSSSSSFSFPTTTISGNGPTASSSSSSSSPSSAASRYWCRLRKRCLPMDGRSSIMVDGLTSVCPPFGVRHSRRIYFLMAVVLLFGTHKHEVRMGRQGETTWRTNEGCRRCVRPAFSRFVLPSRFGPSRRRPFESLPGGGFSPSESDLVGSTSSFSTPCSVCLPRGERLAERIQDMTICQTRELSSRVVGRVARDFDYNSK